MPVVLDISSDEEEDSKGGLRSADYDWIREFLGMSESDEEKSDDSDEVVIIHENKPQSKSKSSTVAVKDVDGDGDGDGDGDDDDDDDCVVLDGDPESGGVTCVDEEENGSDELLVVGEKGQIACRDYPHARHLCAKFPFASTPHDSHCEQCHCYVCDSLAPCLMWGSGLMSSDHCNANDKIDIWRYERKNFKAGNGSLLPASTNHGTSLSAGHHQCNEILPPDIIRLPPDSMLRNQASRSMAMHTTFPSLDPMLQNQTSRPARMFALSPSLNSGVQNQVSKSTNIPVYSTATNLTIPNGGNHGRCQGPGGSMLVRNRSQPHSLPKQWLGVRRHAIHRERGSGASSLGPQFLRSHSMPSRVASAMDNLTVNHPGHVSSGFSNQVTPALPQFDKYQAVTGFSNVRNCNVLNPVWLPQNLPLNPHPGSETLAYSQPLSHSNDGHGFYQSGTQGNDAPSSYAASLNGNQHGNHQIGNENQNGGNIAQCEMVSQETYQQIPQEESPSGTARSWTENISQSIEPLVACSRLNSSGSTNQPPNVNESGTHVTTTGSIEPLPDGYGPLDEFENWLLEKDRASDAALLSEINIPSPDPAPIDAVLWW